MALPPIFDPIVNPERLIGANRRYVERHLPHVHDLLSSTPEEALDGVSVAVVGSAEAGVPQQIFLGTLLQSAVLIAASLVGGKLSDRTGRRKIFVFSASIV